MMTLQDKLNEQKANFEKNTPPEALEVIHRATADLRNSGIADRGLTVGDTAPEFELENTRGKLTFEVLGDPRNAVAQKFGLIHSLPEDLRKIYLRFGIDLPKTNGDNSWTLPLPARFIIDREAVIRYAKTDADYTVRPDPSHTLEALKSII